MSKTILIFEYEWKPEDGIGAGCDALFWAVYDLQQRIYAADGFDDVAAVFKEIRHESS